MTIRCGNRRAHTETTYHETVSATRACYRDTIALNGARTTSDTRVSRRYTDAALRETLAGHAGNGLGREAAILLTVPAERRHEAAMAATEYSNRTGDRYNDCLEIEARRLAI